MKILLVNPRNSDNSQNYQEIMALINKKTLLPPLGLLTVAAILPPQWQKKLIDLNVSELKDSDIKWADYIFLGGMHSQQESMKEVVIMSKKLGARIVIGGPLLSKVYDMKETFSKDYEELWNADYFVLDEAELTLPEFMDDLKKGTPKQVYRASKRADLKLSPVPLWDLIDFGDYFRMSIQFSKGCPHECEFCDAPVLFGHRYRTKSAHQVVKELIGLYEKGWRDSIFVVDDNFILDKHLLKKGLLPEMKQLMERLNYPFQFSCAATMDLADDPDLMKLLVDIGFTTAFLGIETTNIESLKECNKMKNIKRDLPESIRKIHNAGLLIHGGFIIGFDHDTEATADNMLNFIQENGIASLLVGVLYAPPKTKLYNRLEKEKRLHDKSDINFIDGNTNFEPIMGYKNLKRVYKKIHSELLQPKNFYYRVSKCFENHNLIKKKKIKWSLYKIHILLKIVVRIGLLNKRSKTYRKIFFDLFSKYPERLELILSLLLVWHNSLNLFSEKLGLSINQDY